MSNYPDYFMLAMERIAKINYLIEIYNAKNKAYHRYIEPIDIKSFNIIESRGKKYYSVQFMNDGGFAKLTLTNHENKLIELGKNYKVGFDMGTAWLQRDYFINRPELMQVLNDEAVEELYKENNPEAYDLLNTMDKALDREVAKEAKETGKPFDMVDKNGKLTHNMTVNPKVLISGPDSMSKNEMVDELTGVLAQTQEKLNDKFELTSERSL